MLFLLRAVQASYHVSILRYGHPNHKTKLCPNPNYGTREDYQYGNTDVSFNFFTLCPFNEF